MVRSAFFGRTLLVVFLLVAVLSADRLRAELPAFGRAVADERLNARFQHEDGWIGADGAYAVELGAGRVAWLFSDTWVGRVRAGKRVDARMVNNSAAIQTGSGDDLRLQFFVRRNADARPVALISPKDGRGWYWLQSGLLVGDRLVLFLAQFRQARPGEVFGFEQIGEWLGIVANPREEPTAWRVEQMPLPCVQFGEQQATSFGASVLVQDGVAYIFGTREKILSQGKDRSMVLARAPVAEFANPERWQFFGDGKWQADFQQATGLADGVGAEFSVTRLPGSKQYLLLSTDRGLSARVVVRVADAPWGPWSEAKLVYESPEAKWDRRIFCYGAKAQPVFCTEKELVFCYFANSFELKHVLDDARLYWPRFVRLPIDER